MRTAERLIGIMSFLCRERHTTVPVLAEKFGVSSRTIRRDIFELSFIMPLDTKSGKYEGGVYVIGDYAMERMYMSAKELELFARIKTIAESSLTESENILLDHLIISYTKPSGNKFKSDSSRPC